MPGQCNCEIDGEGGLSYSAFYISNCKDHVSVCFLNGCLTMLDQMRSDIQVISLRCHSSVNRLARLRRTSLPAG
jgi:hypothetical protein